MTNSGLRQRADRRLSTVVSLDKLGPGGIAVHKDGRIFIAAMDIAKGVGDREGEPRAADW